MSEAIETGIQQDPPKAQPRGADGRFITAVDEESSDLDPDDQELEAARRALEEEEGGGQPEPDPEDPPPEGGAAGEGQDDPPAAAATDDAQEGQDEEPPTDDQPDRGKGFVPYERFEKVNDELRSMREQMEYLRGALDARKAVQPGQQPDEPAQPDPRQEIQSRIAAAEQAVDEAAAAFDNGKMSMAEFKRLEREQNAAIRKAQDELDALDRPPPQPQEPGLSMTDEMALKEQAEYLHANHPYLDALSQEDALTLAEMARAEARRYGKPYGKGPREDARIREHVARLSDVYGPSWYPDFKPKTRSQQPEADPRRQQPRQPPGPSATATARERKLEMQERLPPDTSRLGTQGTSDQLTEARILQMDEDELAALPAALKARWLT